MSSELAETNGHSDNSGALKAAFHQARMMSQGRLVPKAYQGEQGIPDIMIAIEVAHRIGAAPLQVLQNLHIIQGRPSWSSSFLIATVNACGRFSPLRFETFGEFASNEDYRCRAYATDKASGEVCKGAWITWDMAKAEGWSTKSGSKWRTMPEQMFMYRSAAFWARVYAPEVSMGIYTSDEVRDMRTTVEEVPGETAVAALAHTFEESPEVIEAPAQSGPMSEDDIRAAEEAERGVLL